MANKVSSKTVEYSNCAQLVHDQHFQVMLLEPRPFRPFKTSEEYLYAMKEDLAEWLNTLYGLNINVDNFMKQLETGVVLCRHANHVLKRAREYEANGRNSLNIPIPKKDVVFRPDVNPGTFQARDNVSNFITWCRVLQIHECLLFETDDLVMRKNEKSFILCLLEVARRGSKFGILAPTLVQFEEEIDRELAEEECDTENEDNIRKQIITNDLRSLHERVVELLSRCTCPTQYSLEYISDGKYRIGDTKVLIFVRILRSHVMVRVGGGWDTLEHYLDKHDPCRCRSGHRYSYSARLSMTPSKGISNSPQMQVIYSRPNEATTSASYPRRASLNNREIPQLLPPNNSPIGTDLSKQNKQKQSLVNASNPDNLVQNNSHITKQFNDSSYERNDRIENKLSPQRNFSANKSIISPQKQLPKSVVDSSSSEYSENESKLNNGLNLVNNRGKKCSPRKILKTNEDIMNSNDKKLIRLNRRYSESDESSIASDEMIGSVKYNPRVISKASKKSVNPSTNRTNNSNLKFSKSSDNIVVSQSNDDIRQICSNKLTQNCKSIRPMGYSPKKSHENSLRRLSADNSQSECNVRYGSFPRSRSQSSQLQIYESNPNKTNQILLNSSKPFVNNAEKGIKSMKDNNLSKTPDNPCRQVKTWTFKQRSRLPLNSDLYKSNINSNPKVTDINSQMKPINRSSSSSQIKDPNKSLELSPKTDNHNENDDKLLEKMKHLVQKYDIKLKNRQNFHDLDALRQYPECPSNKTVISTGNKTYISKIPTLQ